MCTCETVDLIYFEPWFVDSPLHDGKQKGRLFLQMKKSISEDLDGDGGENPILQ